MNGDKKSGGDDGTAADAESENPSQRRADADARVAGIEAMLKDMSSKLENTQAAADEAARKADESNLEGHELRKQLALVMSEKNAVERMLDEMAKKKEAAEEAASAAEAERAKVYDENKNLLDTVTVLKDARAADHAAHAVTVRKWRNELVAYREKTPTEFLAEVLSLVRDMDNEVELELIGADLATQRVGGGSRVARSEELQLCDEWTHNPALAMARPDRLCRLASRTRQESRSAAGGGGGGGGDGSAAAGPASLAAAGASGRGGKLIGRGVSGAEVNVATPTVAARKRREALGAVDVNVTVNASADASQPRQQLVSSPATAPSSLLEPHYVEFDSPSFTSPKKLARSAADDGLVAVTAPADVENAAPGGRVALPSALSLNKAGFSAHATLDLSSMFAAAAGAKAATAAASVAVATGAVAGAGVAAQKLGDSIEMYDDFAELSSPAATRGAIAAGK